MNEDSSGSPLRLSLTGVEVIAGGRPLLRVAGLEVRGATLLHLTGENGAGKTTLLRALTGEAEYRGSIRIGPAMPGTVAAKALTAYVPTDAALLEDLTVRENLTFMARAWRCPEDRLYALAQRFGLSPWLDAWPAQLSRGTRQKVALSIGLGLERPLTLLDEPFGTLDTASRVVLLNTLEKRAANGLVIVTTHGEELSGRAGRALHIEQGQLVEA